MKKAKKAHGTPKQTHHTVQTFIEDFQNEIENLPHKNIKRKL